MKFIITLELTILVSVLAILSGVGSYLQGVRENRLKGGVIDFLAEVVLALTVGLGIAYTGHSLQWNEAMTCALVLAFANNGADTLAWAKKLIREYLSRKFGINDDNNQQQK